MTVVVFGPADAAPDRTDRVVVARPTTSPGRALALLEDERAEVAVLPIGLAAAVAAHPARALTDLGALRRVVCTGDGPLPALPGIEVGRAGPDGAGRDPDGTGRDPVAAASAAGDAALAGLPAAVIRAAGTALDHAATLALCRTLARDPQVAPEHLGLVARWRSAVGPVRPVADTEHDAAWDDAERTWAATAPPTGDTATVRYARRCAALLPGLLAGEVSPLGLLFPEGRHDLAHAVYREPVVARYQLAAAGALVAATHPRRVLEIGAGTGATTDAVVAALGDRPGVDLHVTDLSSAFLDAVRDRHPAVRTSRLDVDLPLGPQGVAPGSCDVVVAGGVLNAVADTDRTLAALAEVLAPDGLLVLTEPTREEPWVLLTQGFLLGAARDDPARAGATFLDHEGWRAALRRIPGTTTSADLPGPDHVLAAAGHRLFAVRRTT